MTEDNKRFLEELRIKAVAEHIEKAKIVVNYLIKDISSIKSNGITNLELQKYHYLLYLDQYKRIGNLLYHPNVFEVQYCGPVVPDIYRKYLCYGSNPLPYDDNLPDIEYVLCSNSFPRRIKYYHKFIDFISKVDYSKICHLILITMGYNNLINKNKYLIEQEMYAKDSLIWEDAMDYHRIFYSDDIYYNKRAFEVNLQKKE